MLNGASDEDSWGVCGWKMKTVAYVEGSLSSSLSPKDLWEHQNRVREHARTGRVGLGREFYDIMMKSMEDD